MVFVHDLEELLNKATSQIISAFLNTIVMSQVIKDSLNLCLLYQKNFCFVFLLPVSSRHLRCTLRYFGRECRPKWTSGLRVSGMYATTDVNMATSKHSSSEFVFPFALDNCQNIFECCFICTIHASDN